MAPRTCVVAVTALLTAGLAAGVPASAQTAAGTAGSPAALAAAAAPAPLSVGVERAISTARPGNIQSDVDVAWNGSVFFVVWQETPAAGGPTSVYGARVRPDGTVLDPRGIRLATGEVDDGWYLRPFDPSVAAGSGRFLVVWEVEESGNWSDIHAALVGGDGRVLRTWGVALGEDGRYAPEVAWNGQLFLVVYEEDSFEDYARNVYGTRVLPSGLTLDGCSDDACPVDELAGLPIALDPDKPANPVVAGTDTGLVLVGWTYDSYSAHPTARMTAVGQTGQPIAFKNYPLTGAAGAQTQLAVATNGAYALWAWTNTTTSGTSPDIRATTTEAGDEDDWWQRYWDTPSPPADGVLVSGARGAQRQPDVAGRSGHFVVVWTDLRSGRPDVYASRVGSNGAALDPNGVVIAAGSRVQRMPSVASTGSKLLVAYQRDVPTALFGGNDRIFVRIVR